MAIRRVVLIYDDRPRPETTGVYCLRALRELVAVEHHRPGDWDSIPRQGVDLYVNIDDGFEYRLPAELRPAAWWVIDTHLNLEWDRVKAADFDCVFAAQRNGAAELRKFGIATAMWLPLACDPAVHRHFDVPNEYDWCFVGTMTPGQRSELATLLSRYFPKTFVGQRYFEEMAKTYSASHFIFNRSIRDDINMRVFESIACRSLLLTNALPDNGLPELFRDGVHLATYANAEELLDKARFYLSRPNVRNKVAATGSAEALKRHTYRHRMEQLLSETARFLERRPVACFSTASALTHASAIQDNSYFNFDRPELLELVPTSAVHVLDVGCGAGRFGAAVKARQNASVTGIEQSVSAAAQARTRLDRVVVGDVELLEPDWPKACFDAVVCGDVLEHLREPAQVLRNIRQWLKPNGCLVASIPNVRHNSVIRSLLAGHWQYETSGLLDRTHLRFFTRREIEKLLFRCGFRIEQMSFVPGSEFYEWEASGRPGRVNVGPLQIAGLTPDEAAEFHAYQYVLRAVPATMRDEGLTSIVVVTRNGVADTRSCLNSLRLVTDEAIEVIIIDNASTDGTLNYLNDLEGIRIIRNSDNRGYSAALRQGLIEAKGSQVLLLHNDTVVTTGWLRRLLDALFSEDDVGLVGPSSDRANGAQQIDVSYDPEFLDGFAWDWARNHNGKIEEVETLSGFCLLARRDVLQRFGLFDEQFAMDGLDCDELCRRARRIGSRCLIARAAFIRHMDRRGNDGADAKRDVTSHGSVPEKTERADSPSIAPHVTTELTSIIIVTFGQLEFTRACVESIRRNTAEPYELIFVDNGSIDGTPEYLRSIPEAVIIVNRENRGFPVAANQGVRAATGRYVLLLNNDTVVPQGWLSRMVRVYSEDSRVGLVGPCSNVVSGEQLVDATYQDLEGLEDFARDHATVNAGIRQPTDRLVGFCLLIKREVIDQIGMLDEQFGLGCFEDDDYTRRALHAGWHAVIARDAYVHHDGNRSFSNSGVDLSGLIQANRELYLQKWGDQQPSTDHYSVIADSVRQSDLPDPGVLVIAHVGFLRDRMDKNHFYRYDALARRSNVTLFGPGLSGYRPGMTVQDAINVACQGVPPDVILHGGDLFESGVPLVDGLAASPIVKAIELLDSWIRPDQQADFIRRQRFDLGLIAERGHHIRDYQQRCPQTAFVWTPNAVNTSLFRDYRLDKRFDIILYGNLSPQVYPLRARLAGLLSRQTEFSVRTIPHPGYYPNEQEQASVIVGEELARAINEAWIGIATSSIYRVFLFKYLEIAASGTLVAGDLTDTAREVFGDDFLELSLSHSDDEIMSILRNALADKDRLRERIDAARQRVVRGFSTDAFSDRLMTVFRKCCLRKRHECSTPIQTSQSIATAIPGELPTSLPGPMPAFSIRRGTDGALLLEPRDIVLSLCMIVRNNASTIRPALESIRGWVDEMIVVDTGSTDDTPAICARMGARVSSFPWVDDFSAARNESFRLARGRWLFWMDSDDTISSECGRRLRQLALGSHDPNVFGYVIQVRCPGPAADDQDVTVVDHVKLVRNHVDLRFEGRIHEQLLPSIRRFGGEVAWTELFVTHSGYDHGPGAQRHKLERDLRLLELELADRPEHTFTLFNLGMTWLDAGRFAEAADYLRRSIRAAQPDESHVRKAYALLTSAEQRRGDWPAAWAACVDGLSLFQLDDELRFRKGLLQQSAGNNRDAVTTYQDLLTRRETRHFTSAVDGINSYKARHNLALAYEALEDWHNAKAQWQALLAERPGYPPALIGLSEAGSRGL